MARTGIDASTGKILVGWDHVVQSIGIILSTELRSRVQRRDYGSLIPRLIDRPQNPETIVNFYMAIAEALEPRLVRGSWYGEPCFHLSRCGIEAGTPGSVSLILDGTYFPNGHKNDFAMPSPRRVVYSAQRLVDAVIYDAEGPK